MRGSDGMRRMRSRMRLVPSAAVKRRWDFDPEDVARLDKAHLDLLAAADRVDRRLARERDRQRLVEAEAAERTILSWMGLESYLDYRLRSAGVVELDDLLEVVDLTEVVVLDQPEPGANGNERADWKSMRSLLRPTRH